MAEELTYIAPGEGLPGFPSGHGPGWYFVDYEARTIRLCSTPELVLQSVEIPQPIAETATDLQPEENQGG